MGHMLNVESDEAVALATELAELRGESLDTAVTHALRQLVEQERRRHRRLSAMREAASAVRATLKQPAVAWDHDSLYDAETGLPR